MTTSDRFVWASLLLLLFLGGTVVAAEPQERSSARPGLLEDPEFFPIGVWLQQPKNAAQFQAGGFNLYVGLWKGPTKEQLAELGKHGMPVICHQNEFGLEQRDNPLILAWMHGDEPDNAQPLGKGKGYGPPISPEEVQEDYRKIRKADPSRPVFLNRGQLADLLVDFGHSRKIDRILQQSRLLETRLELVHKVNNSFRPVNQ